MQTPTPTPRRARWFSRPLLTLAILTGALVLTTVAAPQASAERYRSDRGDRSSYADRYDRGHHRTSGRSVWKRDRVRSHDRHYSAPRGYYRQVYVPAVYRTTYDPYGHPRRVCVRPARFDRVWVSTTSSYRRSRR